MLRTSLVLDDVKDKIEDIVGQLYQEIPAGVGSEGAIRKLSKGEMKQIVRKGAGWAIEQGFGRDEDLDHIEEHGCIQGADPDVISQKAYERGSAQVGTLGSGNHFFEVDLVEEIYHNDAADAFGLFPDQICLFIHSGSRGFGYQVCEDYLRTMEQAMRKYQIQLPDRQLACAPLDSPEGKTYIAAMSGAANFAFCNRQVMKHLAERALLKALNISPKQLDMRLVYDVCHNIGKFEEHKVNGGVRRLFIHRKGATRAFPPGHPKTPLSFRHIGQPVLIPGDMGTGSWVLVGTEAAMEQTFGTSCHGAGRVKSRNQALRDSKGRDLFREMRQRGVVVMASGKRTVAEEMPEAYKNVNLVVDVIHNAGISLKVARLKPIGVVKG